MQISLIVFRELLEIFLLLSMIFASCHGRVKNLHKYIWNGLIIGILGASLLAIITPRLSNAFNGLGQEISSSIIILAIAVMLATTIIYMQNYSKNIKLQLDDIGDKFQNNIKHQTILVLLISSVIFREGAEMVLLIYGVILSGKLSLSNIVFDVFLGSGAALFCAFLFYKGLLKTAKLFKITSIFLMLVCAGLASESIGILCRSGIVNILTQNAWDLSSLIPEDKFLGQSLKILINYSSQPSILEVLVFLITFGTIFYLSTKKK